MKNNSKAKNINGNMSTKTVTKTTTATATAVATKTKSKKNTNSVTSQVSEWVVNTLSNTLSTDQVNNMRTSLESKQGELQKILNKENKQTTKREKDVNAPKRGNTSYIFFCMDTRAKIQTKNPTMSAKDIIKELGTAWRSLNDNQKDKYVKLAETDKQRYTGEIGQYSPPENFSKKKTKSDGPKRGLSSYIFFCNEQRNIVKEKNPSLTNKELTSELGKKWNLLTDEQKKPYNTLATNDKTRYENEKSSQVSTTSTTTTTSTTSSKTPKAATKTVTPVTKKSSVTTKTTPVTTKSSSSTKKKTVSNNGFLLFCQEERDILQDEHPKWTNSQLTKELGKAWNELKNDEQEEYNERAEGELVEEE